ncbi:hypothetical protein BG004_004874 [Podila humilis]|nr:hypothetical protein BG004_004874 [Podila humilis]
MNDIKLILNHCHEYLRETPVSNWSAVKFYQWVVPKKPEVMSMTPERFVEAWIGAIGMHRPAPEANLSPEEMRKIITIERNNNTATINTLNNVPKSQPPRTDHSSRPVVPINTPHQVSGANHSVPTLVTTTPMLGTLASVSGIPPSRLAQFNAYKSTPWDNRSSSDHILPTPPVPGPTTRATKQLPPRDMTRMGLVPSTAQSKSDIRTVPHMKKPNVQEAVSKKRKAALDPALEDKHYDGRTVFVLGDSDPEDSVSVADDILMEDRDEDWEDVDDSDEAQRSKQSGYKLQPLGFTPMIDVEEAQNAYLRPICQDIQRTGANTIVFWDADNKSPLDSVVDIDPSKSHVFNVVVQGPGRAAGYNKDPRYGYVLTTHRPYKEAADHEMFMLVCALLYAGMLYDKIVFVVSADRGLENIVLFLRERSISSIQVSL